MEGNTSSSESTTVSSTPWIIDTVLLILLIILIFLLLMCYLMPSFLYNASDFLQPGSIKMWVDYFDVLLIIIAISSHLLSRYGSRSSSDTTSDRDNELVTSLADTYSSEEKFYDAQQKFGEGGLKRISNSYPDLRNESLWGIEDYGSRFFDDFDVDMYRPVQVADNCSCARRRRRKKKVDSTVNEIPVLHPPTPPKSPPPEDSVVQVQTSHIQDHKEIQTPLTSTEIWNFSEESMSTRSGMKKSSSAKDLATAIASSFISQRERKRKQKIRNLPSSKSESSLSETLEPEPSASMVPPPPPPPPPPSIFYNLFKRGRKIKRIQTVNSAPPTPPPLPQRSVFNNLFKNGNASKRFQSITGSSQPPYLPPSSVIKSGSISEQLQLVSASAPTRPYSIFNNTFQSGTECKRSNSVSSPPSPQPPPVHIQLLLPPPPPPLSELELAEEMNSGRNRSDDLASFRSPPDVEEDVNSVSSISESRTGRDVSGWMICPTPDVNMKADTFIARLRGEWKTEIMNSLREGGESSGI